MYTHIHVACFRCVFVVVSSIFSKLIFSIYIYYIYIYVCVCVLQTLSEMMTLPKWIKSNSTTTMPHVLYIQNKSPRICEWWQMVSCKYYGIFLLTIIHYLLYYVRRTTIALYLWCCRVYHSLWYFFCVIFPEGPFIGIPCNPLSERLSDGTQENVLIDVYGHITTVPLLGCFYTMPFNHIYIPYTPYNMHTVLMYFIVFYFKCLVDSYDINPQVSWLFHWRVGDH